MGSDDVVSASPLEAEGQQAIRDLILRVRPRARLADYPSPTELGEIFATPTVWANTRLWRAGPGQVVAYALVDAFNNILFDLDYAAAPPDIEAEIIAWGIACRQRAPHAPEPLTLDACCRDDDRERVELLRRHGFVLQPQRTLQLERDLGQPLPAPCLPAGYTIRPLNSQTELEAWVNLHRAAFGTDYMTLAQRAAMMTGPEYEAQLDLVAVAPEGELAAYCFCWISHEENSWTGRPDGHTDPVATHPAQQRRGLAQALLLTGLRLLRARGLGTAVMKTTSDNLAMQRAAAGAGYAVSYSTLWWSRPV